MQRNRPHARVLQRHYYHGDVAERGTFYSARDDAFLSLTESFLVRPSDVRRLRWQLKRNWVPRDFFRPCGAPNVFTAHRARGFAFAKCVGLYAVMITCLQAFGLLGEGLSGLIAVVALVLAIRAVKKTIPNELEKFRATKREEKRAEVAETAWMAVFRLAIALRDLANPGSVRTSKDVDEHGIHKKESQKFFEDYSDRYKVAQGASNEFLNAWGSATLFLDSRTAEALNRFWLVKAQIFTNIQLYAMDLDKPGTFPDVSNKLFGPTRAEAIDKCEAELRALLEPIARLKGGGPINSSGLP